MTAAMSIDMLKLTREIEKEHARIMKKVPDMDELAGVQQVSDADDFVMSAILPIVKMVDARSVLKGVQRHVDRVGCSTCLEHLDPVRELGAGADGRVWLLESGKAAKLGNVLLDGDYTQMTGPDPRIEKILHEVAAARIAGKANISPVVHDAWFCTSATRIAYIIVMDAIPKGQTLHEWRKTASEADKVDIQASIEALVIKMNGLGIFHDDLHSANVVVDDKNTPWIIDFSRCTYLNETAQFRSGEYGDLARLKRDAANSRMPIEITSLAQLVAKGLVDRGVIALNDNFHETSAGKRVVQEVQDPGGNHKTKPTNNKSSINSSKSMSKSKSAKSKSKTNS